MVALSGVATGWEAAPGSSLSFVVPEGELLGLVFLLSEILNSINCGRFALVHQQLGLAGTSGDARIAIFLREIHRQIRIRP